MNLHKRLLGKVQGPGASLGALECWPTNVVGEADNPCLFELAAVGHHDDDDDDGDGADWSIACHGLNKSMDNWTWC